MANSQSRMPPWMKGEVKSLHTGRGHTHTHTQGRRAKKRRHNSKRARKEGAGEGRRAAAPRAGPHTLPAQDRLARTQHQRVLHAVDEKGHDCGDGYGKECVAGDDGRAVRPVVQPAHGYAPWLMTTTSSNEFVRGKDRPPCRVSVQRSETREHAPRGGGAGDGVGAFVLGIRRHTPQWGLGDEAAR